MVRPERFELPAFWFVARRSIQLSYGRTPGRQRGDLRQIISSAEPAQWIWAIFLRPPALLLKPPALLPARRVRQEESAAVLPQCPGPSAAPGASPRRH